jgi:hypothetical protein
VGVGGCSSIGGGAIGARGRPLSPILDDDEAHKIEPCNDCILLTPGALATLPPTGTGT